MKSLVVTRSFYEAPYLNFFIKYYLAIGFDKIVILKSDKLEYNMDHFPECRVKIIQVDNFGNQILDKNKDIYLDPEYDWVLNVDADEFFIFDMDKFGSVNEYINHMVKVWPDTKQFMYRWVCSDKLSTWDHPPKLLDYVNDVGLCCGKYLKSLTKISNDLVEINCHFFNNKARDLPTITDQMPISNISVKIDEIRQDGKALCDGFILHLHTRSITNSVIKALVTKLMYKKQIRNKKDFASFISRPSTIADPKAAKQGICNFLNHKWLLAIDNHDFNKTVEKYINWEHVKRLINSCIYKCNLADEMVYNIDVEWSVLKELCNTHKINFDNLKLLLDAF